MKYIHGGPITLYEWVDCTNKWITCPIYKGKRLITVHAGTNNVFYTL